MADVGPRYRHTPRRFGSGAAVDDDALLNTVRVINALDTIDQMGRRDAQMQMEAKRLELNQRQISIQETEAQRGMDSELRKARATDVLAGFVGSYDNTDVEQRGKKSALKSWATGEGLSAQEVDQIFQDADTKDLAMENVLSNWRVQSGVDWVKVPGPDGRERIDITATEAKHNEILNRRKTEAESWSSKDRMVFDRLKTQGMSENEAWVYTNESATAKRMLDDARKTAAEKGYPLFIDEESFNNFTINLRDPKAGPDGVTKGTFQVAGASLPTQEVALPLHYYDLDKVSDWINKKLHGKEGALTELQTSKETDDALARRKAEADARVAEARAQLGAAGPAAEALATLREQYYRASGDPVRQAKIQESMDMLVDILPTGSLTSPTVETQSGSQQGSGGSSSQGQSGSQQGSGGSSSQGQSGSQQGSGRSSSQGQSGSQQGSGRSSSKTINPNNPQPALPSLPGVSPTPSPSPSPTNP